MIQNRVYRERIANMMVSKWQTSQVGTFHPVSEGFDFRGSYRLPNGGLDMEKLLSIFVYQNFKLVGLFIFTHYFGVYRKKYFQSKEKLDL